MAFMFNEVRINYLEDIEKHNPYHGKDGKFTTKNGASSIEFTPVNLNDDTDMDLAHLLEFEERASGDKISVGGVDYRDIGSDGYYDYIKEHGTTSEHLSEDLQSAYDVAEDNYVGTGNSFKINRYLRMDQDRDKYTEHLLENDWFTEDNAREVADAFADRADETIEAMDKMVQADSIKEDIMLTRNVGYESTKSLGPEIREALSDWETMNSAVDLINARAGQIVTEKGYMSASMTGEINWFKDRPVRMGILTPEGTPAFITDNESESEVVLGRNTQMRLVGAQMIEGDYDKRLMVIYQILNNADQVHKSEDIDKSSVRTPETLTVEPADDVIRRMMGLDESGDIVKYNHNHGEDGKFASSGITSDHKARQFQIISESNPMQDDYHTGIRSEGDIMTFSEAIKDWDGDYTDDWTHSDMEDAQNAGKVTVFSSHPIKNGTFVTPSRQTAQDYAGSGKVYSREASLTDVAWIDAGEGQFAEDTIEKAWKKNLTILCMMGVNEDEIKKYNHNHDADGKFCAPGAGVVVDPSGKKSSVQTVSKLTGQPVRDYSKEICSDVIRDKEFKEARRKVSESSDALRIASDEAHDALKAMKPKPREEWDSDDELKSLMGIKPMTGEKEWRDAYKKEDVAREQWEKDANEMKKIMVDAQGGAKTNKDFDEPQSASKAEYPGFKDKTGVSWYDDTENLKYHGLQSRVVEMSPTEYLERCAANFNSAKDDKADRTATLAGQILQLKTSNVEKLQKLMENGEKMDMPYLNVGSGGGEQEGRHRAMAAYNLGMEKIPVLYVDRNGITKSAEDEDFQNEQITKFNPYHGKDGRFTTSTRASSFTYKPGQGKAYDNAIAEEKNRSDPETKKRAWSDYLASERSRLSKLPESKKALYASDHHIASMEDCVDAMKNKKSDALLDDYFKIMEKNGDPTPIKETRGQINIRQEAEREGYAEARLKHIMEDGGLDRMDAEMTMQDLRDYFDGRVELNPSRIDDYIDRAPAFDGTMYRGMYWDRRADNVGYGNFMSNIAPGSEINMRGHASSWSSNEEVSRGFASHGDNNCDSVMLVCVGNRTSTPVEHLSSYGEDEVLASSKARWTVLHSETAEWPSGARKTWIYVVEKGDAA